MDFKVGDLVKIESPTHGQHGAIGTVIYHGKTFGTWGVKIDYQCYGFFPNELKGV